MSGTFFYCDNYASCNSFLIVRDLVFQTEAHARAKGWHLWRGITEGGKRTEVTLCGRCVDSKRRQLAPASPPLEGDVHLF